MESARPRPRAGWQAGRQAGRTAGGSRKCPGRGRGRVTPESQRRQPRWRKGRAGSLRAGALGRREDARETSGRDVWSRGGGGPAGSSRAVRPGHRDARVTPSAFRPGHPDPGDGRPPRPGGPPFLGRPGSCRPLAACLRSRAAWGPGPGSPQTPPFTGSKVAGLRCRLRRILATSVLKVAGRNVNPQNEPHLANFGSGTVWT